VAVHSSTRAGDPGTAIVERAAEIRADLVVLGSRGRGHVVGNLLGSVSAAVASNAYCSVLVVRRETLRSLLLADDGSDGAHIAARTVLAWSFLARIPTAITNIVDMHESDPAIVDRATNAARSSAPVNGAHRRAAVAVDRRVAEFHAAGRMAIGHVRHGEPSVEILRAARGAGTDLIVVGESNDRPGGSSPLGGVARSVLSGFHGSVLIARAADQVTPGYPVSAGTQSAWSSSTTAGSATIALRSCPVRSDARRQRL
jgi:nucleotide-binding universal stress UspA family protein